MNTEESIQSDIEFAIKRIIPGIILVLKSYPTKLKLVLPPLSLRSDLPATKVILYTMGTDFHIFARSVLTLAYLNILAIHIHTPRFVIEIV